MKLRLLVADDDPLMRVLISATLDDVAETVEAADGNDALLLLKREYFDALLLDWDMPGANGLEVLMAMRDACLFIPVLMVTGAAEKSQILEAIEAGASDYLLKPFDGELLRQKISRLVECHVSGVLAQPVEQR